MATLNVNVKVSGGNQSQQPKTNQQLQKQAVRKIVKNSVRNLIKNNGPKQNNNISNKTKQIPVATPVPPEMKFVSHMELTLGQPVSGTFDGPRIKGTVDSVSGDWVKAGVDNGILNIDAKVVGKTHDGEVFLAHIVGRCVRNPQNPSRGQVRVSVTFETNSEKYHWMNKKVLSGVGRKVEKQVSLDYFEAN